jgi:hypothetical protein
MEENVRLVDEGGSGTLFLSKIFSWYSADFGSNDLEIAACVSQWMRGAQQQSLQRLVQARAVKIRHLAYDWGNNAKNAIAYSAGPSPHVTQKDPGHAKVKPVDRCVVS